MKKKQPEQEERTYWSEMSAASIKFGKKYTPEALWEKAVEYFEWVQRNPLKSNKAFALGANKDENKMRAMSIRAFCVFAGITRGTYDNYRSNEGDYVHYLGITEMIDNIIYTQKFEGASAGLLHASIVSRDLGLTEKVDITTQGDKIQQTVIKWGDKEIKV